MIKYTKKLLKIILYLIGTYIALYVSNVVWVFINTN